MALMKKPKQKLISVSGAKAKASANASKRAKAVKPAKKKSKPTSPQESRRGGSVKVGDKSYAKVYNRSPK